MKNKLPVIFTTLIILIMGSLFFFSVRQTTLVGIGDTLNLQTEEFDITFQMNDKYYEKSGCDEGATLVACNVKREIDHYELDCPVYHLTSSGGYAFTCPNGRKPYGGGYRDLDTCEGTRQCSYDDFCSRWCKWQGFRDHGLRGGAEYTEFANCAWQLEVDDKNGNLVQEFNNFAEFGSDWEKTGFYRKPIDAKISSTSIKKTEDIFGVVQRRSDGSSIKSCISVKFQVEDDRYRYNVCLGNDGLEEPECDQPVEKVCKLTCFAGQELDIDTCTCKEKTEPETVEEPEPDKPADEPDDAADEPDDQPKPDVGDPTTDTGSFSTTGLLTGIMAVIMSIAIIAFLVRNANGKK